MSDTVEHNILRNTYSQIYHYIDMGSPNDIQLYPNIESDSQILIESFL